MVLTVIDSDFDAEAEQEMNLTLMYGRSMQWPHGVRGAKHSQYTATHELYDMMKHPNADVLKTLEEGGRELGVFDR